MNKYFEPKRIYYEKNSIYYPETHRLLKKYSHLPHIEIEAHHDIAEFKVAPDTEYSKIKDYLVLGVRKSFTPKADYKSSDFILPFTSSGCSGMCLYCYLMCHFFKSSNLRVFVNREEIMKSLFKLSQKSEAPLKFELGSNSDLILENTVTNNLPWVIETIAKTKDYITFATKYADVDSLLNLSHGGHTIFRMSFNPEDIISSVELRTAKLHERIEAINKMAGSGYRVGINLAPIILSHDYREKYSRLLDILEANLTKDVKNQVFFELIFMTMGKNNLDINSACFPNIPNIFDKKDFRSRGVNKYCYKKELTLPASIFLSEEIERRFGSGRINYIV